MADVQVTGALSTVRTADFTDEVATEEPLEIRVDGRPVAVTTRTPGHDAELALGFLFGESLIDGPRDAQPTLEANTNRGRRPAQPRAGHALLPHDVELRGLRQGALEDVAVRAPRLPDHAAPPEPLLAGLPERLHQPGFDRTGGLHATGLFTAEGELLATREDVGRHNAMDKVIGWALAHHRVPLHDHVLAVSGRLSFEPVQKAVTAGATTLVGVGAPTSLAVRLADDRNLTLSGFARGGRVKLYT